MRGMDDPHGPLRGEEAGELLRLTLQASGLELRDWRRTHLFERPGAEASAIFSAEAFDEDRRVVLHLVGSTVRLSDAQRRAVGAVCLSPAGDAPGGSSPVHIWPHPADPELPGLPTACDAVRLGGRISAAFGEQVTVEHLSMLVLRPLRRAVLRASLSTTAGTRTVYVKVLRPQRAALQLSRHRLLPLGPEAVDLGEGIVLLEQAAGLPLTEHLHHPGSRPGTAAAALERLSLKDLLSPVGALNTSGGAHEEIMSLPRRTSQTDRLEDYARVAVRAGADQERISALCRDIRRNLCPEPGPLVPTHGDLHPANIFLELSPAAEVPGLKPTALRPSALIDLDSLGPGLRADDLACLLAHLWTLPTLDPDGYRVVPELTRRLVGEAAQEHCPRDLGARIAGVLLSLLPSAQTGDRREAWLSLAEGSLQDCD